MSGEIKANRLDSWEAFIKENSTAMIYCFRGGSRSSISQEWISKYKNHEIVKLEGGYKAFRNYLINELDPTMQTSKPIILSGFTGCGKTILLNNLENSIDLEDEGRNIGINFLPKPLAAYFNTGDLVILDSSVEERINLTLQKYVINSQLEYIKKYGNEPLGLNEWFTYISDSIIRVKKRLGLERFNQIYSYFKKAYENQIHTGSYEIHKDWISFFLTDYYDPMYQYQLNKSDKKFYLEVHLLKLLNT